MRLPSSSAQTARLPVQCRTGHCDWCTLTSQVSFLQLSLEWDWCTLTNPQYMQNDSKVPHTTHKSWVFSQLLTWWWRCTNCFCNGFIWNDLAMGISSIASRNALLQSYFTHHSSSQFFKTPDMNLCQHFTASFDNRNQNNQFKLDI